MATFGIAAYSFPCGCGLLRREAQPAAPEPLDAFGLARLAADHGLRSVETPLPGMLPDLSGDTLDRFQGVLEELGLSLVVDTGVVERDRLEALLPSVVRTGARVVRATLSTILEGARAGVPGGWDAYMEEMLSRVVEIRPVLEAHGVVLALENHQDATSDDLLKLCEAGGECVGVTLDVANPLAVGEEPLAFASRVGPLIRNVHLKDYKVYLTPSGYRLVRCALGEGVVPFEELLPLLRRVAPDAPLHIELAALYERHIRLLEDDWWGGYPPRDARSLVPALRLVARHARPPEEDWQTPWERGAPDGEVARWEREQLETSIEFLRAMGDTE
jgi:sugar phosphate isomerase/epimerase